MKKQAQSILKNVTGKDDYILSSKTVSFMDLARGSKTFIKIKNWDRQFQFVDELEKQARAAGFIFEFGGIS